MGHIAPTQACSSCPGECDDVCEGGVRMERSLSLVLSPCPRLEIPAPRAGEGKNSSETSSPPRHNLGCVIRNCQSSLTTGDLP